MAARPLRRDIRVKDVDGEVGIHGRYACFTDGVANDDALSSRNEHAHVGVRLEPGA